MAARILERATLAALLLAGAVLWCLVLSADGRLFTGPAATVEDWPKELRHYTVLQQALSEGRAPLFLTRPTLSGRKLLAIPELNLAPPVLLLSVLAVPRFVLVDTLVYYVAGWVGLLLLRRRLALGLLPTAFLALLFFFNGHLVAHMAVGHSMWAAHFLAPFMVVAVLALAQGRPGAPAAMALLLFAVLLRGGFHLFTWCVLLLLLLAAFDRRRWRAVAAALLWAAALGAARLAPAAFLARRRDQPFLSGFPSTADLWHALVSIRSAAEPQRGGFFGALSWWEYDTYVGPVALAWLLLFGLLLGRRLRAGAGFGQPLYGAMAVLAVLALGDAYLLLNVSPVPLLNAERVSSRLLIVPLLLLATLAAVRMQRLMETLGPGRARLATAAGGLALAGTAFQLARHAWAWRLQRLQEILPARRGLMNVDLAAPPSPLARSDLAYVVVVAASALVSLGSLALLAWRVRRGRTVAATARPALT